MSRARALLTLTLLASVPIMANSESLLLYLGTQNAPDSMGLASSRFDTEAGTLSTPSLAGSTRDPAFFAIHPDRKHLYICNTGTPGGISAFGIDRDSGALKPLNHVGAVGRGPSHVSVDRSGRYVLNANYGGGYVEVHAIEQDGSLGRRTAFIELTGSSVHPQRQTKAYAHWFGVDPSNRFALIADLGTDRIMIYRFDAASGALVASDTPFAKVRPGSGPRHLAFHPNTRWMYAVQELSNEVIAFSWDDTRGILTELQTVSTLPADFQGPNTAAEIGVHTNGRFLYVSNRGHDSIAVFAIDPRNGHLKLLEHVSSRGKTPRYFAFDPSNRWLVVSNQEGDSVAVFRVDAESGKLAAHGEPVRLVKPMGVEFLR
jgi:6-phosphogluconolactonase